nr:phosphatase PAP2 family protein [Saccharopolyspora sp. HNM0983]
MVAPFAATAVAYLVSTTAKDLIQQDRPCRGVPGVRETVEACPEYGDWSLPSNHTTIAAALAVAIALLWRRFAVSALAMALLAGFSRILVGAHYPHDVLAGMALGALVAVLAVAAVERFSRPPAPERPLPEAERV